MPTFTTCWYFSAIVDAVFFQNKVYLPFPRLTCGESKNLMTRLLEEQNTFMDDEN